MSSRILADDILSSETLNELCPEQECLWYRILVSVDDYGCMDARPIVVLARCYPLRVTELTPEQVDAWLHDLAKVGLITMYQVDGKAYLQVGKWEQHQRIRSKRHKCPLPDQTGSTLQQLAASCDNSRNPRRVAAIRGELQQSAQIAPSSESFLNPIEENPIQELKEYVGQNYAEIIAYLNAKAHTTFKPSTNKTQTVLRARCREGFTLENFKTVIDNMVLAWYEDPKMQTYLRPETLFGTKFESYLTNPPKRNTLQRHVSVSDEHDFDKAEDHIHAS